MPSRMSFLLLLISSLLAGTASAGPGASFTGVGDLPGGIFLSRAYGVSGDGSVVVGESYSDLGREGFVWRDGEMTNLGQGGINRAFYAASQSGELLVGDSGATWENGVFGSLHDPGSGLYWTAAFDVTPDGSVIVGRGVNPDTLGFEAFLWEKGSTVRLGDLDGGGFSSEAIAVSHDGRVVVGMGRSEQLFREAFLWTAAGGMRGLGDLPGGNAWSAAIDVSADGSVVVGWGTTSGGTAAVYWENGVIHALGSLPGLPRSTADAISPDGGTIVGGSWHTPGVDNQVFLWTREDGMRSLHEILSVDHGLDLTGWQLEAAYGISDDGRTIVGQGTNPEGDTEGWVAVLPADTLAVSVDIRPWSDENPINPLGRGVVPVAILGSEDFDVADVDVTTLAFGPDGAVPAHKKGGHAQDVDADGFMDLVSHYRTQETGIAFGDSQACLTGETLEGMPLRGCDAITTEPSCGNGLEVALAFPPLVWVGGWMRRRRQARDERGPVSPAPSA